MVEGPEPRLSGVEGPRLPPDTDLVSYLLSLSPERREEAIEMMALEEREAFDRDWPSWAHDGQEPPPGCPGGADWRTWVIMGGRSFGKTISGSNWITAAIATEERLSIALVGATLDEARRVMVEGRSGLLEVADAWVSDWNPSLRRLRFRTGAEATLFSGASPEQLRGPAHHFAWCDELAKWEKAQATWDMLQFGLRLGALPRTVVTTTPRPGPVLRAILAEPDTIRTGGPTSANPHNPRAFIESNYRRYRGTRLGRQELDGELLTDAPGALWTAELLERCRVGGNQQKSVRPERSAQRVVEGRSAPDSEERPSTEFILREIEGLGTNEVGVHPPPGESSTFTRILIGVDPPSGDGTCGIIACAKDEDGIAHLLADHSVTARSPEGWSRAVADAAEMWSAQPPFVPSESRGAGTVPVQIVAEANQGGKMVKAVLHTADPNLRVKLVTATVGKAERAAPVAMLFEAGKVVLHGRFPELEAELLGMIAGGEYEGPGVSPDRADAMVWALTELMLGVERAPQVRAL